jgi:hypothetical protein
MAVPVLFDSNRIPPVSEPLLSAPHEASRGVEVNATGIWRWVPSLPLLIGLFALLRVAGQPLSLLNDPDTYLHIAAGRWIIEHGALPTADPFSHTMPGAAWVPHEWLSEFVLAVVYNTAGWSGVIALTGVSFAAAVVILFRQLLRHLEPLLALVIIIAAVGLLLPHLLARPHTFALPLMVLWCAQLFDVRDAGRPPPLVLLPVMTLWANLHGSFMFGIALGGFLAVEAVIRANTIPLRRAETRRWAMFLSASVVASLLTPNGIDGVLLPFRLLVMPTLQSSFGEWVSPSLAEIPALEVWVLGAIGLAFLSGVKLPVTRLLLLLGLFYSAFQHVRHLDLLAIVAPLAIAAPLGTGLAARALPMNSRFSESIRQLAIPAHPFQVVVATLVGAAIVLPTMFHPIARADDAVTPGTALLAAAQMRPSGPVLDQEGFGGYLIFRGVPTFIDGRIELYGDAFLATYLKAERGDEAVLNQLLDRYRIGWTLFAPEAGAVAVLDRLPGWRRVYADAYAVIHLRSADPAHLDTHRAPL